MKDIHPELKECNFTCATCGNSFEVKTTMNVSTYPIDVCSKCHSFYIGKVSNKSLRGKSEKLMAKFEVAKNNSNTKVEKKVRVRKQKAAPTSLESL